MIHVFNRALIFRTYDVSKYATVKRALENKGIKYSVKLYDRRSIRHMNRGATLLLGAIGENKKYDIEYSVYVKRDDVDFASYCLREAGL